MAMQALTGTLSGAAAGASIGSVVPGWGTLIGGVLGGAVGLIGGILGDAGQAQAEKLQAQSQATDYKIAGMQAGVQIQQTQADISAYDSFLAAFPNYADLQKNTFEAQSRNEFRGLLNNYAMGNAGAGATGRVGGSASLFATESRNELSDFAGRDLKLGGAQEGRYAMAQTETYGNLTKQETQAQGQLAILQASLPTLQETQAMYTDAAAKAQARS